MQWWKRLDESFRAELKSLLIALLIIGTFASGEQWGLERGIWPEYRDGHGPGREWGQKTGGCTSPGGRENGSKLREGGEERQVWETLFREIGNGDNQKVVGESERNQMGERELWRKEHSIDLDKEIWRRKIRSELWKWIPKP